MLETYPFGKTPLKVRVARYIKNYQPARFIPIHPTEYNKLADSARFTGKWPGGYLLVPLGYNPASYPVEA